MPVTAAVVAAIAIGRGGSRRLDAAAVTEAVCVAVPAVGDPIVDVEACFRAAAHRAEGTAAAVAEAVCVAVPAVGNPVVDMGACLRAAAHRAEGMAVTVAEAV